MRKWVGALCALAALTGLGGCGESIKSGFVGVRVIEMGSRAGVQEEELGVGWKWKQWGSYIMKFPTTVRTEVWSDAETSGGPAISFNNSDGVTTRVAVSILLRIDPARASDAVQRYRLGFDELVDGPVRRRVQGAFVALGSGPDFTSEALVSGPGAAALLAAVKARVEAPLLEAEGVIIENIELVGAPRLPDTIMERINDRVKAEQEAQAQQAQVAVAEAQAAQAVATARGQAEAIALTGEALRRYPEVLRQREIERWRGWCPLDTNTCVVGSSGLVVPPRE